MQSMIFDKTTLYGTMANRDDPAKWFLVQLKPNCRRIAERNLERQGIRTFMPRQEETRRAKGKFTTAMRPLFPGYLFVSLNLGQGKWRAVNSTQGVSRLVCLGQEPTPLPDALISHLMTRCDASGTIAPLETLGKGDKVLVTKGPMVDFIATVEKIEPGKRVYALMELMGAQTRVILDPESVRAL